MTITELIKRAHDNAVNKGFYPEGEQKNIGELLMLIVSELGEALEAHRKNKFSGDSLEIYLKELNNPNVGDCSGIFEHYIKYTFEDELADAAIRIFDMCGYLNIDLEKHIELKMKYNETREYKHGKRY